MPALLLAALLRLARLRLLRGFLLSAIARQLLHLPAKLLRLTPQHLLFPALLETLLVVALLLLGQLLLALGEFFQFLERLVHLAFTVRRHFLRSARLVLVLVRIQLEVEQAFQIAALTARAAGSTAALTKCDLDFTEDRLGTKKVLQRLLLRLQSVFPLQPLQLLGSLVHRLRRRLHVQSKQLELFVGPRQIPALHSSGERPRLLA